MSNTSEEILEAVLALDASNDEHWTADGMPRLDAVENLLGGNVTRKSVTNAAPDFTRTAAVARVVAEQSPGEPDEASSATADVTETDQDGQDRSLADDDNDSVLTGEPGLVLDDDPLAEGPADREAQMDAEIEQAHDRVVQIQQDMANGKQALAEAESELSAMIDAKNKEFPPMTQAEAIQNFQRSEHAKREAAHLGGAASSPLDQALNARSKARH